MSVVFTFHCCVFKSVAQRLYVYKRSKVVLNQALLFECFRIKWNASLKACLQRLYTFQMTNPAQSLCCWKWSLSFGCADQTYRQVNSGTNLSYRLSVDSELLRLGHSTTKQAERSERSCQSSADQCASALRWRCVTFYYYRPVTPPAPELVAPRRASLYASVT